MGLVDVFGRLRAAHVQVPPREPHHGPAPAGKVSATPKSPEKFRPRLSLAAEEKKEKKSGWAEKGLGEENPILSRVIQQFGCGSFFFFFISSQ